MFIFLRRFFKRSESPVYRSLVCACMDKATAERLLNFEIRKDPRINRHVAVQRAYDRLVSDRSR